MAGWHRLRGAEGSPHRTPVASPPVKTHTQSQVSDHK